MPQAAIPTYRVKYEPSRGSWLLTGPVGAKGCLYYQTARDAADYARWDARDTGGTIDVLDQQGQLYRKICLLVHFRAVLAKTAILELKGRIS